MVIIVVKESKAWLLVLLLLLLLHNNNTNKIRNNNVLLQCYFYYARTYETYDTTGGGYLQQRIQGKQPHIIFNYDIFKLFVNDNNPIYLILFKLITFY